MIATDTAAWLWTPATHTAIRLGTVPLGTLAFLAGSEAETALTGASRDYAVARDGTETLAGRAADRVVLTPLPGSAVAGRLGKTTLTLDHQYAVPLAGRILDPSGGSLFEWTFVNLSANGIYLMADNLVASTRGIFCGPSGGGTSMIWEEDFELVSSEWWAIATGAASAYLAFEVVSAGA